MNLPSLLDIDAMFQEVQTPMHVRRHCEVVGRVATCLATALHASDETVNIELVENAALLHDLFRVVDFKALDAEVFSLEEWERHHDVWEHQRTTWKGIHHADVAARYLSEKGYPELAIVVSRHRFEAINGGEHGLTSWEDKLVYYADKRVAHDQIVSFADRIEEAKQRYQWPQDVLDRYAEGWKKVFELEKEIFLKLSWDPSALITHVEQII